DDRFDGTDPISRGGGIGPFRTIARALRAAAQGDQIVLADTGEPYRESITLQGAAHSGLSYQDLRLSGNGAVLDGSAPIPRDAWQPVGQGIWRFSPRYKSHQQLFLDGRPAERVLVEAGEPALPTLEPLQWCLFDRHIHFRPEEGKAPGDYALGHSVLTVGITLQDVHRVSISDLTIQGFQLDGINAHDNVFGATLDGLTCRGNARSGISVGGASRVRIQRCLVGNNGAAQLRTEGHCVVQLVDCQLLDNTAPAIVNEGGRIEAAGDDSDP
ncbi:MAG: right-handed parallel beta-helix repeat-containing protein, partial [Pirellulaceae bacterium]|nr:right-handed parallel beta-helix repeat-containing protein [Pirellulaceae bacterium]